MSLHVAPRKSRASPSGVTHVNYNYPTGYRAQIAIAPDDVRPEPIPVITQTFDRAIDARVWIEEWRARAAPQNFAASIKPIFPRGH